MCAWFFFRGYSKYGKRIFTTCFISFCARLLLGSSQSVLSNTHIHRERERERERESETLTMGRKEMWWEDINLVRHVYPRKPSLSSNAFPIPTRHSPPFPVEETLIQFCSSLIYSRQWWIELEFRLERTHFAFSNHYNLKIWLIFRKQVFSTFENYVFTSKLNSLKLKLEESKIRKELVNEILFYSVMLHFLLWSWSSQTLSLFPP